MATASANLNKTSRHIFNCDEVEFREQFNRKSFEFGHFLSNHPLFEIPRLVELSKKLEAEKCAWHDEGNIRIDQRWDESPLGSLSVDETIRQIEHAGAWIILKQSERDPEYRALLDECMAEIQSLLRRDLSKEMLVREVIIFIASPNRITPYHIDRECNFILQIHGEKDISVFDQHDRDVLPEEEIERFWTVDHNAPIYKQQYQDRAKVYRLVPGNGIHVPVNAPHWIQNDNNISVTLSVNFQFRETFPANVYRANHLLRRLGLSPTPPGVSSFKDAIKGFAMDTTYVPARSLKKKLRGKNGAF
jgi:hypothetical protein